MTARARLVTSKAGRKPLKRRALAMKRTALQGTQAAGSDCGARADICALGVLLYELLTGSTPFDPETLRTAGHDEIRRIIREVDPPRPSTRLKGQTGRKGPEGLAASDGPLRPFSADLDWIAMKCLEKDRRRLYETASALALDLRRHLNPDTISAHPPTVWYSFAKFTRRHKVAFAAGAAVAVAVVPGLAASVWQAVRAKAAEHRTSAALAELRATAPAFLDQARTLAAQERFAEAIEKLEYAAKLRPDVAEYPVAKADLLQCQMKLRLRRESGRSHLRTPARPRRPPSFRRRRARAGRAPPRPPRRPLAPAHPRTALVSPDVRGSPDRRGRGAFGKVSRGLNRSCGGFPGSALVPSAGFGVPPKRTFLPRRA